MALTKYKQFWTITKPFWDWYLNHRFSFWPREFLTLNKTNQWKIKILPSYRIKLFRVRPVTRIYLLWKPIRFTVGFLKYFRYLLMLKLIRHQKRSVFIKQNSDIPQENSSVFQKSSFRWKFRLHRLNFQPIWKCLSIT